MQLRQRIPSVGTLSDLAYEAGREYDPAEAIEPALLADMAVCAGARPIVAAAGEYERRRVRDRERRRNLAYIPDWFSAEDLLATSGEHPLV